MDYILRTTNLTKSFKEKEIVKGVSLNIKKGEVYGFLGPNGAGKTTIMRMIANLIKPTSGEIEIFGEKLTNNSYEVMKRMGMVMQCPAFYEKLTARKNLELHLAYMGYYDKAMISQALDFVDLDAAENKKVKEFSLGMKQRLAIARAILTKPELLILDEPINGLDPIGINSMRSLFKMLSKEYGITIFISSHILGEIEQIADTVGIIDKGTLIKEVSIESIRNLNTEYIEVGTSDLKKAVYILESNLNLSNYKIIDDNTIRIYNLEKSQNEISKELILKGVNIESIARKNTSLEEFFLTTLEGGNRNV